VNELFEKLAAIEHERWADWQKYVHDQCVRLQNGRLVMPADLVKQWERQIATPYADLSEVEKESDRDQVRRYWDLVTMMNEYVIRTFCWHDWEKWCTPFCGTWVDHTEEAEKTFGLMTQRRTCKKCGRVSYRKCR